MSDQEKFISELWPLDGPHSAGSIMGAAEAIAQLTHYLNRAMGPLRAKADVLDNPADAYTVVGALVDADLKVSEFLARLGHWAGYVASRSMHTDEYGLDDGDGTPDEVEHVCNKVTTYLRDAAAKHAASAEALNLAHQQLSHVYRKTTE